MGKEISVRSAIASKTGEPMIVFTFGDQFVNMAPADADKVALDLIEAAYEARQDAAIVRRLRDQGAPDQEVGDLILLLRAAREQIGGAR